MRCGEGIFYLVRQNVDDGSEPVVLPFHNECSARRTFIGLILQYEDTRLNYAIATDELEGEYILDYPYRPHDRYKMKIISEKTTENAEPCICYKNNSW